MTYFICNVRSNVNISFGLGCVQHIFLYRLMMIINFMQYKRATRKINVAGIAQCDEMKIFGQNLNIMSNRFIWIPIDREKSVFKKIMPGSAFFNLSKFDIFKNS